MKEQLISLETAKLAKEKGFNEPCYAYYSESRDLMDHISAFPGYYNVGEQVDILAAPTQSLLAKWLREKHLCYVFIRRECIGSDEWVFAYQLDWLPKEHWDAKRRAIHFKDKDSYNESPGGTYWGGWGTYEEALEKGLFEALKLIV